MLSKSNTTRSPSSTSAVHHTHRFTAASRVQAAPTMVSSTKYSSREQSVRCARFVPSEHRLAVWGWLFDTLSSNQGRLGKVLNGWKEAVLFFCVGYRNQYSCITIRTESTSCALQWLRSLCLVVILSNVLIWLFAVFVACVSTVTSPIFLPTFHCHVGSATSRISNLLNSWWVESSRHIVVCSCELHKPRRTKWCYFIKPSPASKCLENLVYDEPPLGTCIIIRATQPTSPTGWGR